MDRVKATLVRWLIVLIDFLKRFAGTFSYTPPKWWQESNKDQNKYVQKINLFGSRALTWIKEHKKISWISASLVSIGLITWGGWQYYHEHMPHPEWARFTVYGPVLQGEQQGGNFNSVRIVFDRSVADLKLVGKELNQGISLTPKSEGKWIFESDAVLVFTPKNEWPMGKNYTFNMDKSLFADSVILAESSGTFKTEKFTVSISSSEFYQHPTIPKEKKGVFTLKFNYPVDPTVLADKISLNLVEENQEEKSIKFTLNYDKDYRSVDLHSEFLPILERDSKLNLKLAKGIKASAGGEGSENEIVESITVPGMYNFFKISRITTSVIRNEKFEPEHVFIVETTGAARSEDVAKKMKAYLLPETFSPTQNNQENDSEENTEENEYYEESHSRKDLLLGEVNPEMKNASILINLEVIPSELENSTQHTFRYRTEVDRFAYIKIEKGLKAFGDYILAGDYEKVLHIPAYEKELMIMHSGSILSLHGEKKIPILSRNVKKINVFASRMLPNDLHHFITQNDGDFQHPQFSN